MQRDINVNVSGPVQPASTYKTVVLKGNLPFADQVTQPNTKYVIKYDFTLDEDITVPENCILEFDGGSVSGAYTLTGNNTCIKAGFVKIFDYNIILSGTWKNDVFNIEWFGTTASDINHVISTNVNISALTINRNIAVSEPIVISRPIIITSNNGSTISGNVNKSFDCITISNTSDVFINCLKFRYFKKAISISNSKRITIDKCDIQNCIVGIVNNSSFITHILNNLIIFNKIGISFIGTANYAFVIRNNVIDNNLGGFGILLCQTNAVNGIIDSNTIEGNRVDDSQSEYYKTGCGIYISGLSGLISITDNHFEANGSSDYSCNIFTPSTKINDTSVYAGIYDVMTALASQYISLLDINDPSKLLGLSLSSIYMRNTHTYTKNCMCIGGYRIHVTAENDYINSDTNHSVRYLVAQTLNYDDDSDELRFDLRNTKYPQNGLDTSVNNLSIFVVGRTPYIYVNNNYLDYELTRPIHKFKRGSTSQIPNVSDVGYQYFNTTLHKPIYWDGTRWVESDYATAGVARSGATESRPVGSSIYVGFKYQDTTLGKPIFANAISGDTVTWVDATGTQV